MSFKIIVSSIIKVLTELWVHWDVPLFVMISLFLQLFLICFGFLRKGVCNQFLHTSIWLAYLIADWAAAFTIGLIHYSGDNEGKNQLYSFWAPFLIVHLGGPDTITAISLADNELWNRNLLQFLAQTVATLNILHKKPVNDTLLWLPTILVFVCGLIKYGERVWALYSASLDKFRRSVLRKPDPGPNYAMFLEHYAHMVEDGFPMRIETVEEPELEQDLRNIHVSPKVRLKDTEVVQDAYGFYQKFKGLIVDVEYDFRERYNSVAYFKSLYEDDAIRVVEAELKFMYDTFYTKAIFLYRKAAYLSRGLCLSLDLISLVTFFLWESKVYHRSKELNIESAHITLSYILLLGAIALDAISILLLFFSNRSAIFLLKKFRFMEDLPNCVLAFKSRIASIISRPWSKSIRRFSLLNYYLYSQRSSSSKMNKLLDTFDLKLFFYGLRHVENFEFTVNMRKLILRELKVKSQLVDTPRKANDLRSARGEWILENNYKGIKEVMDLRNWLVDVDYDESLLIWHIATELCYNMDRMRYDEDRTISKVVSDYMVYLQVMKPTMISNVAGISDLRLRDTEAEALRFISSKPDQFLLSPLDFLCRSLLRLRYLDDFKTRDVKGTRSKSVLFEACRLANRLMRLPKEVNRWEVMSKVWVELLCYAASHCKPIIHVEQLSKGGELITVVWLLMTHLGLVEHCHLQHGPSKLSVLVPVQS